MSMTRYKVVKLSFLFFLFLFPIKLGSSKCSENYIISDTFYMENSTDFYEFVKPTNYQPSIGTVWNLTVIVDSNSSSGILVTGYWNNYIGSRDYWEGDKEFSMLPGETHSGLYIAHAMADFPLDINFKAKLLDSVGNSSGSVWLILEEKGYDVDYGTGEVSVDNITAWLEKRSKTSDIISDTTTSDISPFLMISLTLATLTILTCNRRRNQDAP